MSANTVASKTCTQTSWYNVTSTAKWNMATSAERDWNNKRQTVAVQSEKSLGKCPVLQQTLPVCEPLTQCSHGRALELTHPAAVRSYCIWFNMSSKPLRSQPRYTFLQNIYNSRSLFCILWDIKNRYIQEVIYCSLFVTNRCYMS